MPLPPPPSCPSNVSRPGARTPPPPQILATKSWSKKAATANLLAPQQTAKQLYCTYIVEESRSLIPRTYLTLIPLVPSLPRQAISSPSHSIPRASARSRTSTVNLCPLAPLILLWYEGSQGGWQRGGMCAADAADAVANARAFPLWRGFRCLSAKNGETVELPRRPSISADTVQ